MTLPHGRAKVDANSPRAFAICDRCGFLYNHVNLHWQYDFRGRSLANLRILVCDVCEDDPQPQLKPRIIPPDPVPIMNARPERFQQYETNNRVTQGNSVDFWTGLPISNGDFRITQADTYRTTQQTGEPPFGLDNTPGSSFQVPGNDEIGLPYGYTEVPKTGVLPNYSIEGVWGTTDAGHAWWSNNQYGVVNWSDRAANDIVTGWSGVPTGDVFWQNTINLTVTWSSETWD